MMYTWCILKWYIYRVSLYDRVKSKIHYLSMTNKTLNEGCFVLQDSK